MRKIAMVRTINVPEYYEIMKEDTENELNIFTMHYAGEGVDLIFFIHKSNNTFKLLLNTEAYIFPFTEEGYDAFMQYLSMEIGFAYTPRFKLLPDVYKTEISEKSSIYVGECAQEYNNFAIQEIARLPNERGCCVKF